MTHGTNQHLISYKDEWYVVVNKPSGILVHPTAGSLPDDTQFLIHQAAAAVGDESLYPIHRLDRGTSGLLVLARSSEACAALQSIWGAGVVKQYLCCVDGCIAERVECTRALVRRPTLAEKRKSQRRRRKTKGVDKVVEEYGNYISDYSEGEGAALNKESKDIAPVAKDVSIDPDTSNQEDRARRTQECSTIFTREGALWVHNESPRVSLVRCELQTGRRHQIRRHLAGLGHAIFGDDAYGKTKINAWLRKDYGLERMFLHAARLEFDHPFREGLRVELNCPLPVELAKFLRRLPSSDLDQFSPLVLTAVK